MIMNKCSILSTLMLCIFLTSCASSPQTREGYIGAIKNGGAFINKFGDITEIKIELPFERVVSSLEGQARSCIVPEYSFDSRISVSFVSTTTVRNYLEMIMVNEDKAEFSFQQSSTSGVEKHYELVVNLTKLSNTETLYSSYANKKYSQAPIKWAKGETDCFGFDGYIIDAHRQ